MMNTKRPRFTAGSGLIVLWERSGRYPDRNEPLWNTPRDSQRRLLFPATVLIAVLLCSAACGSRRGIQQKDGEILDLMDRLEPADPVPEGAHFERNQYVIRKGLRKKALVIAAPIRIAASLHGVSGNVTLKGWATQVYNIGDGLQMNLFLTRNGTRHRITGRYFDSGRKAEDRDWIPLEIPLEIGKKDRLEIEISAGPQGDLVADWLALDSLALFKSKNR